MELHRHIVHQRHAAHTNIDLVAGGESYADGVVEAQGHITAHSLRCNISGYLAHFIE
jgi:hypothetical protein